MIRATITLHTDFRTGTIDPRLFGSFVEHLGRCVYEGIYDPGSDQANEDGLRTDVLELTRELGVSLVRYPGGNFVSSYCWEDGVGPAAQRPTRLDPAWRSIESNQFGLHEFMNWVAQAGAEPMMAVNLGTRGIQEACDLLEYSNHPGGTRLSDLRRTNGASEPFGIGLWCLGNEMDGPWQIGHKTAEAYGLLAAETAKAMRQIDPSIELVVCGSSHAEMPTFGTWEATVLDHTFEYVDFISLHAYYEPHGEDMASYLASGSSMDRFIEGVVATADHVAARHHSRKRLKLSFDEWNIWYQNSFAGNTNLEWSVAGRLIEDRYTVLDAVVLGDLMISLIKHADRVAIACLAQLVNVIAPIRTEPGQPAWRQSIFFPFALTARFATGDVLRCLVDTPQHSTAQHGVVDTVSTTAVLDGRSGDIIVLVVNRDLAEPAEITLSVGDDRPYTIAESFSLGGLESLAAYNCPGQPDRVSVEHTEFDGDSAMTSAMIPPVSWNLLRLTNTPV